MSDYVYVIYCDQEDNKLTVLYVSPYKEDHYHHDRFVRNREGTIYRFKTEEDAAIKMVEWYTKDVVKEDYHHYYIGLIRDSDNDNDDSN